MRDYEVNFMKLFQKYLDNEFYSKSELNHIILAVDQSYLEKWVTVLTKKRIDDEAKKKENESGWFGFFRKKQDEQKPPSSDDISAEEIDQMYKELYDRFLADDNYEEAKGLTNVKNLNVELLVKEGGLNLADNKIKIKLYFDD